jgi:hypothetical protein
MTVRVELILKEGVDKLELFSGETCDIGADRSVIYTVTISKMNDTVESYIKL